MKAYALAAALLLFSSGAFSADVGTLFPNSTAHKSIFTALSQQEGCEQVALNDELSNDLSGQGCCSHHAGQCGCGGGRVMCCDGSMSPSCLCAKGTPPIASNVFKALKN